MEPFSLEWAAQCVGGQIQGRGTGTITSVCVDSRQARPGALFFALQGETADGHQYVAQALKAGAIAAVVERVVATAGTEEGTKEEQDAQIVVPAALRALGDLARHYRRQFAIPIVGITGSVGKTSTKEMIAAVLRTTFKTLASEKNYNNEIGVPLTLFNLDKTHEAAVIEMGMRGLGQIDYLAEIAQPTIGVITNIGHAHIELLGSQENIARAKAELFARLPASGAAIMPYDTAHKHILANAIPAGCRKLTFNVGRAQPYPAVRANPYGIKIQADGTPAFRVRVGQRAHSLPVQLQAVGTHHVKNALAALAVAYALDIPTERAITALEAWQGAEGRMTVRYAPDDITVLDDCYNASTESMISAIDTLRHLKPDGVAVLGDMKELGAFAQQAHHFIAMHVFVSDLRLLVTVGELASGMADILVKQQQHFGKTTPAIVRYDNAVQAAAHIKEWIEPGDTVLVKGSRAMGMEVIVNALMNEMDKTGQDENINARDRDAHD